MIRRIFTVALLLALMALSFWLAPRVGDPLTEKESMSR